MQLCTFYCFPGIVRFFNICCAWNGYSWNLRSHGQRQCSRIEPTLLSSAGMQLMVPLQLNVSNSECQCGEYDNTWRTLLQICSFTFRFATIHIFLIPHYAMTFWASIREVVISMRFHSNHVCFEDIEAICWHVRGIPKLCFKNLSHMNRQFSVK